MTSISWPIRIAVTVTWPLLTYPRSGLSLTSVWNLDNTAINTIAAYIRQHADSSGKPNSDISRDWVWRAADTTAVSQNTLYQPPCLRWSTSRSHRTSTDSTPTKTNRYVCWIFMTLICRSWFFNSLGFFVNTGVFVGFNHAYLSILILQLIGVFCEHVGALQVNNPKKLRNSFRDLETTLVRIRHKQGLNARL